MCVQVYAFLFTFALCEGQSTNNLQQPNKADYPFIVASWPNFHLYRELHITRKKQKDLCDALFVVERFHRMFAVFFFLSRKRRYKT